jgi:hypothetical protein
MLVCNLVGENRRFETTNCLDLQFKMEATYASDHWYRHTKVQHSVNLEDHSKEPYLCDQSTSWYNKSECLNTLYYCSCLNTNGI